MAHDALGFTRQTAMILRGLNAQEIIEECERRNVSTETLHRLSKLDLLTLGVEEERAAVLWEALAVHRKSVSDDNDLGNRLNELPELSTPSSRHLALLSAYVAYVRLRLNNNRNNTNNDNNTCMDIHVANQVTASDVLPVAVLKTVEEIEEAEKKLLSLIDRVDKKEDVRRRRKTLIPITISIVLSTALLTTLLIKYSNYRL